MQVKDLTIEELKLLIQETVAETIQSLLIDPDEGRQVKPEVKQQLLNSLHRTQAGERGISALGSCKEIGLELVMTYYVEFTLEATDGLEQLTSTIQQRILSKIRWLSENLDNLTPQPLSADLSGLFKLRIGDYRIIYSFDTNNQRITVHKVGHRRDVYN